jgi:hypothetical protein
LKHTISGDYNLVTKGEIEKLLSGIFQVKFQDKYLKPWSIWKEVAQVMKQTGIVPFVLS